MSIHAPVNVSISVFAITGLALPFARVTFGLTGPDVDLGGGVIAPEEIAPIICDVSGNGTASLWPNAAGTQGTQYRVEIVNKDGELQLYGLATIPATNCNLVDVLNLTAPPALSDAQAAQVAAQAYAAQASASAVSAAASAANAAVVAVGDPSLLPTGTATSADASLGVQGGVVKKFGSSPSFSQLADPTGAGIVGTTYGTVQSAVDAMVLGWAYTQSFSVTSATRDANEAITTASIVWPDGATGTFTSDTLSVAFPGAIDAWHATHVLGGVTKTATQTAVTRDAAGAVTAQPAITVA